MNALIIGAAGFVGSYLAKAIQDDLLSTVFVTKLPKETFHENCKSYDLNIMDLSATYELLDTIKPNYIFHLAAQSSISYSWKNPRTTVEVNVKGSLNVLDAIRKLDYKPRVLMVGSGEEYGSIASDAVPISETELLRPGNIYAATKACQNMMSTIYCTAYGMNLIMVRAFNHVGPGQAAIFVVSDFCNQVAKIEKGLQEPVLHVGNLNAKRDFTDVRDVVHAYTSLIQFGIPGETYNVGSGHAITILDILNTILSKSKVKIKVVVDPQKLRPIDIPIIEADTRKIYGATGWKPQISLDQTIEDMINFWRSQLSKEK